MSADLCRHNVSLDNDCLACREEQGTWSVEQLREWLDRKPLAAFSATMQHPNGGTIVFAHEVAGSWRDWFDGEAYLGVSSARTGPDPVGGKPCGCDCCEKGRQAAVMAPVRANGTQIDLRDWYELLAPSCPLFATGHVVVMDGLNVARCLCGAIA